MTKFDELPLPPPLIQAVAAVGYEQLTPIQAQSLPVLLDGRDLLAQAQTGSGKTAAFALAMLARLRAEDIALQGLVLCPTRELADQVSKDIRALARFIPNVKVLSLCGGISIRPQLASLTHEPHIVVGTPGRIQDLIRRKALNLQGLSTVVLDEADRMLDMGFLTAVENILTHTPKGRATWLFSATYPEDVESLSRQFQRDPMRVAVEGQHDDSVITQRFYKVEPRSKSAAVVTLLQHHQPESCLVFCNTKVDARNLTEHLRTNGVAALELHGDLDQRQRDETLVQFSNGSCRVLVATDVAARGLDIKDLPMVIAYELANETDVHVHRIGRTGRAGAVGQALTLVAEREMGRLARLESARGEPVAWMDVPPAGGLAALAPPAMQTLVFDAGRKDKLRPGDILGALTGEGGLKGAQIGKIDLFATRAYVAVASEGVRGALKSLRAGKVKGRRIRIRLLSIG